MGKGIRKQYTKECTQEAVRLLSQQGREILQTVRNLGLHESVLRRWVKAAAQEGAEAFRGHGTLTGYAEARHRLRRELERTRQERDIQKKAMAFFAKESRYGTGAWRPIVRSVGFA